MPGLFPTWCDPMPARILILFAHPSQHRSEVNLPLLEASRESVEATVVDLYAEYPDYCIDIDREQQRLREHDVIVFMFPLFWYSTPAILKEWQDLVLEYGFAYGHDGRELEDKQLLCALTAGGPEDAYRAHGYNHYSIRELLRPIEQTATLCGMVYLPPYALFGARTALDDGRVDEHIEGWKHVLDCLQEQRIDFELATKSDKLNDCLGEVAGDTQ
jgi:putative NADPH-quinone reductase